MAHVKFASALGRQQQPNNLTQTALGFKALSEVSQGQRTLRAPCSYMSKCQLMSFQYILTPKVGTTYTIDNDFSQDNKNTVQFFIIQPIDKRCSKNLYPYSPKNIFVLVSSSPCRNSVKNGAYIQGNRFQCKFSSPRKHPPKLNLPHVFIFLLQLKLSKGL